MDTSKCGFLFIGDPHAASKKIGRRMDNYPETVMGLLRDCCEIAEKENLIKVFLGDLFHRNNENDLFLINSMIKIMQKDDIILAGNHDTDSVDSNGESLSDYDVLAIFKNTGVCKVISQQQYLDVHLSNGHDVRLHFFPHKSVIPSAVDRIDNFPNIGISHHDLSFGKSYPGSEPLRPIQNMDMVINGHMHQEKPSEFIGGTWWHNPGNITPITVDLKDQECFVSFWRPGMAYDQLGKIKLRNLATFNLSGLDIEEVEPIHAVNSLAESFAAKALIASASNDTLTKKTDEGTIFKEDLELVLEAASEPVKNYLQALATQILSKN